MPATAPTVPVVAGLPIIGSGLDLARHPFEFLRTCYREHGPVFQLDLLRQRVVVFAGPEANLLLKNSERTHFAAAPAFERLSKALDTKRFLMSIDGDLHKQLRNAISPAVGHKQLAAYVPELEAVARDYLARWGAEGSFDVRLAFKRLVYAQLGGVLTDIDAADYYDDVVRVFDTAIKVALTRAWPWFMRYNPRNLLSQRRLRKLEARLMASARDGGQRIPDLVKQAVKDGVLEPDDLLATLAAPYFAGIDTVAASLSFAFYSIAAYPEQAARVREELLATDEPMSVAALRKMPTLRSFVLETLRCYPVTILAFRETTQTVEFAGHRIPAGMRSGFALSLPMKSDEFYPEPERFDIDRFPGGKSHAPPGVYQPFGTGPHVCLGAGLADVQMLVVIATLIRDYELTLDPPDYVLQQKLEPFPVPKGLRATIRPRDRTDCRAS